LRAFTGDAPWTSIAAISSEHPPPARQGLTVSRNTILGANDNRIEDIKAGPGGTGQYGNAINAFRAGNVIVRGNQIRNCDYSAVRGNSASNIQISGNSVSDLREVALYSEIFL
jgi:hypothetical protein